MNAMAETKTLIMKPVMHIFSESNQGGREHNEDHISVQCERQPTPQVMLAVTYGTS